MQHLSKRIATLVFLLMAIATNSYSQSLLNKNITIEANKKPLKEVLKTISNKGQFHFSYNSNIIREDSLVTISVKDKPVSHILDALFNGNVEYKEKDNYIILQRALGYWHVSGYVIDETTGERIPNASVYEKNQFVASLTDDRGFFKLKLKDRMQPATISISKAWYADTSLPVKPGIESEITVSILPKAFALDSVVISPHAAVEDTWLGKFFLSSRQRMQSLNLSKFFVDMPYQASVLPGIGTHGKMGGQVTNKVSFNMLGGYAAGVNGAEIGGLFNIVKGDARYTQIAGLFNITGGKVTGAQVAGLYNHVLDSLNGVQVAGLSNMLLGGASGAQISGLYGHVQYNMYGTQISGLSNFTRLHMDGAQIAGLTNFAGKDMNGAQIAGLINTAIGDADGTQIAGLGNVTSAEIDGVQIAGLFNFAKKLNGVQIGIINIADTSSGYSIGILNIVRKGFHKLSLSANEVTRINAAYKAGNKKLYSILFGGWNANEKDEVVTWGYGIGTEITMAKWLSLNPELTSQYLYLGEWNANNLSKLHLDLTIHLSRYISLFGGPSINVYVAETNDAADGFRTAIPYNDYRVYDAGNSVTYWVGWHAGVNFF